LIELAASGLFRAKWTERIHDEWIRNLLANRDDLDEAKLRTTAARMDAAVLDALVRDYDALIPALTLPDPDDRHIMAAAIKINADAIVTFNKKDFPDSALSPYGIEVQHPDDFIHNQFGLDQAKVVASANACRTRLKNPTFTGEEYLDTLLRQGLPQSVAALKPFWKII